MRIINIPTAITMNKYGADKFLNEGHRVTTKTQDHLLCLTFNGGVIDVERMKEVDFYIDLLYQGFILKNDITKLIIDIDKRQKDYLIIKAN